MYVDPNCKTKKELKELVAKGEVVMVFQPGLGSVPSGEAEVSVEGPHYPKPHSWYSWYARVRIKNQRIIKVLS